MKLAWAPRFREITGERLKRFFGLFYGNLRENRWLMGLGLASGFGAVMMRLLRPWPVKLLFDGVLIPDQKIRQQPLFGWLLDQPIDVVILSASALLLLITLLWSLFSYAQTYLTARAGQLAVYSLRQRVYARLLRLSLGFHQRRERGDLLMRLTGDINLMRDMLVDSALLATSEALMLVAMVAVMFAMDVPLALLSLSILPLIALTTVRFSVRIREAARRQRQKEGRVAAVVGEMLRSVHLIQAFGREEDEEDRFQRRNRMSLKAGLKTTRLEASMSRIVEVLLALGTALVLWLGVHRVRAGVLTPGDLLVFTSYLHSSYRPLRKLSRVASRMSKAVVCADRVVEVLRSEPKVIELPGAKKARDTRGLLELRRVSFAYPGGKRALHRVSLTAQPGQFIGLAGPSGAGKSTTLALLLRLYDPKKGKVLLDGRDIRRLRLPSLRDQISVVLQEPIILGATIRENIAFGAPDASDDEVERAAKLANAHEFVCELAQGYDTPVAEAGESLSAGQRQRLSIARAFLRDTPILLLDEPTQGLDAANEWEVTTALRRLMRGRTALVAAHKLDQIQEADEILVFKRGRIVERGTHDELLDQDGWYARSWALQRGAAEPAGDLLGNRNGKVVEFAPAWRKRDDHLRASAGRRHAVPPFDPAILDVDAVAQELHTAGAVAGGPEGELRLVRSWPYPKLGLVSLFEDAADGETRRWGVHAMPGRIPGMYREALRRGTAVELPGLSAVAHAFPCDPSLIGLEELVSGRKAERYLAPWFRQVCEEWSTVRAKVVAYKPTRRCVIRYRLEGEDEGKTLYAKSFPIGGSDATWKLHRAFRRALGNEEAGILNAPKPLGVAPGHELVLWRKAPGSSLYEHIVQGSAAGPVRAVGCLLAELHRSGIPWSRTHNRMREFGTTAWWGWTAAAAFPERADAIEHALETLRAMGGRSPEAALVATHRDFHDKQVLIDDGALSLLDLETACRAEPELDVANFLAHLDLRDLQGIGAGVAGLGDGFVDEYADLQGRPEPLRLSFYRASALLRLSFVYALRGGEWAALSTLLFERARSCSGSMAKTVGKRW